MSAFSMMERTKSSLMEAESILPVSQEKKDFYISYVSHNNQWAEWIAFHLRELGYSFILPGQDFGPGTNVILETHKAVSQCERTIVLLSPQYIAAMYASPDWTVAFLENETGEKPRLLPIRVQQCEVEGILKPYKMIELADLTEEAARDELVRVLQRNTPRLQQPPRFPGRAATILGALPERNPLFVGREEVLKSLYHSLHAGHTIVALTPSVSIEKTLSIGKTAIAVEYVYRNQCEYDAIFWLSQNPENSALELLLEQIRQVAEELEETAAQTEKAHHWLHILNRWLESHINWLLILDGLTTPQDIQDLFLSKKQGHIIVTTRERSIASIAQLIELEDRLPEEKVLSQKMHHLVNAALRGSDGKHFLLGMGTITVGSAADNQFCLRDPSVAPYHAMIQLYEGSYVLIDMQSASGTFLNRQRLVPYRPYPLQAGDAILIGQKWLAFGTGVTRLISPSDSRPGSQSSFLLPKPKHSGYARMVAEEQQKHNPALARPVLTDVSRYLESVEQENIPSNWFVRRGDRLPPSHLPDEDLQDIAFTTKVLVAFLLATLVSLLLLLTISNNIMPFIIGIFSLDIAFIMYYTFFMISRLKKPPHPALSQASQAVFILAPEGFIEYLHEQEIISVSFHELGGIGIEYDEDGIPWLELSYFGGISRFWSQHAYFGQPEFIAEKIFRIFLEYARKYHTLIVVW